MSDMKKAIKNNISLMVDLLPNRDVLYSGICIKNSHEVFVLICFSEETKEYDGIAILRSQEIEEYRYWDDEELAEIENNNHKEFIDLLPYDKLNTFYDSLEALQEKELIAIYTSDDNDTFYLGKITELTNFDVTLKLINESGKWIDSLNINIDEITYIGTDSTYEKELIKLLH